MKARVLFLCTGNSCRSQMAEGWLRHLAGDRFEVFSAGTKPAGVNPTAVAAMREAGVDISAQESKNVATYLGQHFGYIITVCDNAKEACPIFPGPAQRIHWSFDDPASASGSEQQRFEVFRRVRDEIRGRIEEWIRASAEIPHPLASREG